jgi:hypothetical protein
VWAPFFLLDAPPLGGGRRAGISSLSIGILARAQALQFRCQLARLCFLSAKATLDLRPASNFHPGTNQPIVHFPPIACTYRGVPMPRSQDAVRVRISRIQRTIERLHFRLRNLSPAQTAEIRYAKTSLSVLRRSLRALDLERCGRRDIRETDSQRLPLRPTREQQQHLGPSSQREAPRH